MEAQTTARTAADGGSPVAERVSLSVEGAVAHVQLARADKMNALDDAMFEAIIATGQRLHSMRGVRCVVLSGAGRSFCAGLDLASMANSARYSPDPHSSDSLIARTHGNANRAQEAAMVWRKLPVPVVAAIHGVCFGGGLQVASGADIRVIAPDARLAIMESKWGLVPDMGGYVLWRGNVRDDVLRELTYTHREFTGEEAARFGFATHVDPNPLARAMAIGQEIAACSPHATRAAKHLAERMPHLSDDEMLMAESVAQQALMGSRNQIEAVRAGLEKRPAQFEEV